MKSHGSSRLFYFVSLFYRRLVTGQASCSVVSPTAFMTPRCAFPLGLLMCDVVENRTVVRAFSASMSSRCAELRYPTLPPAPPPPD